MLYLGGIQAGGERELQAENSLCKGTGAGKKIGSENCEEIHGAWPRRPAWLFPAPLPESIFLLLPYPL